MPHFVRGVRWTFSPRRLPSMWCRHCQQDVPAARDAAGPPACSRCRQAFAVLPSGSQPTAIADCGVSLEEFDRAATEIAVPVVRPKLAADSDDLRRLERLLRPQLRSDFGHGSPLLREPLILEEAIELRNVSYARRPKAAWGVNLLLAFGAVTFACGAGLLVAANMLIHALAWRWGFALTIAGEGLLIGGLAAMAVRLWRNSRRMNSQLESIDRRLEDVQVSVGNSGGTTTPTLMGDSLWRFERGAITIR